MILAWDAVPAGPIGPRPKWPTTSLSRKSVRVADSVTEGNCENVQQHQQQKSSGILDRVARDLDWLVAYKWKENSISMHVLGSDCIWNEFEPSKWYRIHKSHGREPEPHKIHMWAMVVTFTITPTVYEILSWKYC